MANHPQAEKRARQGERRRVRNKSVRTGVRTAIRRVREAVAAGDGAKAAELLAIAVGRLDRAYSKGVYKRRTSSRLISALARQVQALRRA